jgi:hypothetical protein
MRKFTVVLLALILAGCPLALVLTGCGVVAQVQNYRAVDDYRDCLAANPNAVQKCEAARLSMIAAGRKLPSETITVRDDR